MYDTLQSYEAIRHPPDTVALALHDDDLETEIMIQVYVQGGHDSTPHLVLDVGQGIGKFPDMVIVDQGHRADGLHIGFPLPLNQIVPYEIP